MNEFCSQQLKREILTTFGFNSTALRATQPKLLLMFCGLFLKIALSAILLVSVGHLRPAIRHRWTITRWRQLRLAETIKAFKDNISEPVGDIQLYTTQEAIWMKLFFKKYSLTHYPTILYKVISAHILQNYFIKKKY